MKLVNWTAALALGLGGAAFAQTTYEEQTTTEVSESAPASAGAEGSVAPSDADIAAGVGGSGASVDTSTGTTTEYRSSTAAPAPTDSEAIKEWNLKCHPSQTGTGGSGEPTSMDTSSIESSSEAAAAREADRAAAAAAQAEADRRFLADSTAKKKAQPNMRGLSVMAGAGVEGYTGSLAPRLDAGPTWAVTAAMKPSRVLGIELGYSGAVNELDNRQIGAQGGADIVRNGGQAALTVGLTSTPVYPFLLGGVGIDHYSVRGGQSAGFRDDTSGQVPLGGGVRAHFGNFTADLRANYSIPFSQEFAAGVATGDVAGVSVVRNAGRYTGQVQLGGTF